MSLRLKDSQDYIPILSRRSRIVRTAFIRQRNIFETVKSGFNDDGWCAVVSIRYGGMLSILALCTACAANPHEHPIVQAGRTADSTSPPASATVDEAASNPLTQTSHAAGKVLESGEASWYASKFQGRRTASGERFDSAAFTAAHRTLPLGSYVRVTSMATGKSITVRINDRGPFVKGRIIDLSYAAAQALGLPRARSRRVQIARTGKLLDAQRVPGGEVA